MPNLNLYLVTRPDNTVDYDETESYVVAAADEGEARAFGEAQPGAQSSDVWYSPTTTVVLVGRRAFASSAGVIHSSFRRG